MRILSLAACSCLLLISACASNTVEDSRELKRVASSTYLYPVIDYGVTSDPQLSQFNSDGEKYYQSQDYEKAAETFEAAANYVEGQVGQSSPYLLPVLDWLIRVRIKQRDMDEADRLQRRYHEIVLLNFSDDERVKRDSAYRQGCWHYLIGDFYEAMFDFEELITELERKQRRSERDDYVLKSSKEFADTSAQNCRPDF